MFASMETASNTYRPFHGDPLHGDIFLSVNVICWSIFQTHSLGSWWVKSPFGFLWSFISSTLCWPQSAGTAYFWPLLLCVFVCVLWIFDMAIQCEHVVHAAPKTGLNLNTWEMNTWETRCTYEHVVHATLFVCVLWKSAMNTNLEKRVVHACVRTWSRDPASRVPRPKPIASHCRPHRHRGRAPAQHAACASFTAIRALSTTSAWSRAQSAAWLPTRRAAVRWRPAPIATRVGRVICARTCVPKLTTKINAALYLSILNSLRRWKKWVRL